MRLSGPFTIRWQDVMRWPGTERLYSLVGVKTLAGNSSELSLWACAPMNGCIGIILAEGAMTLPVTLSGGVLFAS